jgi:hypothetical protein
MLSEADIEHTSSGWWCHVRWAGHMESYGPYRWRWIAWLKAYLNDDRL